ncbi:NAD(P)H-dependent oxidoreductase [Mesohalobacter salilacus]|uniref:NAD(P)H-dependent oxidoreductase n=1 Tax=Mesohalobacter salilacus TaxID=2491711 RepID=UPI0026D10BD5
MDILKALNWRYATKSFDDKKLLPEEKILNLKRAFNLTPTSYGLQPLKLVVLSDKTVQEKLYKASFNQEQVKTASHVFVLCVEKNIDQLFIENHFELVKQTRRTPDEVLKPFRDFLIEDFSKKNSKQLKEWATNQAYLAIGNMLTVCALEKVDACPMEGFDAKSYASILGLNTSKIEPVLVMPVGYRAQNDEFSKFKKVRRPLEDVIIEINN